jgi:hypothetical protein
LFSLVIPDRPTQGAPFSKGNLAFIALRVGSLEPEQAVDAVHRVFMMTFIVFTILHTILLPHTIAIDSGQQTQTDTDRHHRRPTLGEEERSRAEQT